MASRWDRAFASSNCKSLSGSGDAGRPTASSTSAAAALKAVKWASFASNTASTCAASDARKRLFSGSLWRTHSAASSGERRRLISETSCSRSLADACNPRIASACFGAGFLLRPMVTCSGRDVACWSGAPLCNGPSPFGQCSPHTTRRRRIGNRAYRPIGRDPLAGGVGQEKAARALLGWSQERLAAEADVSVPTVKRLEAEEGMLGGRSETGLKIKSALQAGGVEFIDENGGGPGVRPRKRQHKRD